MCCENDIACQARNLFENEDDCCKKEKKKKGTRGSTWKNIPRKIITLLPFIWPKKSRVLRINVVICVCLLILGRIINVFVPIYQKMIVNHLGGDGNPPFFCWKDILIYIILKFCQGGGTGGMGLLNNLRSFLWISIQQYTSREVQLALFSHLHSLSLRWHLGRKTGEVIRIMDRGTTSTNQLLHYVLFSIIPTIIDVVIAIVYFAAAFDAWFGCIVFVTMVSYIACTIIVTERRTKYRRNMNLADNELKTRGVDSLINYETVKYYGADDYETELYKNCILKFQKEEWRLNSSLVLLNSSQNFCISVGLLAGSLYCAWLVSMGNLTVGDYVLFTTYILQLYVPLNWFGTYYRMIQQSFIDMENMFDLMDEKQEVLDLPDCIEFKDPQGHIEFKNVSFYYQPERIILKDISFQLEPGKTMAIVGPSGAGKSTIIRLIFRFFDVTSGAVIVDGKDVRAYSQKSLRMQLGVVPQDTVLFNETLSYNIRYGKVSSCDGGVKEAAKKADIHDTILDFPESYKTRVGERGLKLSGGEKQRIAIARTVLKAPKFILLDEATSALDTKTERNIQASLLKMSAGRSTIIVAHRLSTIVHSDSILVLVDGRIAEMGTHQELLKKQGVYEAMWQQQLQNIDEDCPTADETPT